MPVQPVDLVALVSSSLGILVLLVPVIGLTVRFTVKPLLELKLKLAQAEAQRREADGAERRLALLEQQVQQLGALLARQLEAAPAASRSQVVSLSPGHERSLPPPREPGLG